MKRFQPMDCALRYGARNIVTIQMMVPARVDIKTISILFLIFMMGL